MRLIPLTKGFHAIVDDEDYDYLMRWKWHVAKGRHTYYAHAYIKVNGRGYTASMHKLLMPMMDSRLQVDHKNGNGLDCQKHNLRPSTRTQNCANRTSHSKTGIVGVSFHGFLIKRGKKYVPEKQWLARLMSNGTTVLAKRFKTKEEAIAAYKEAAEKYHGEFKSHTIS